MSVSPIRLTIVSLAAALSITMIPTLAGASQTQSLAGCGGEDLRQAAPLLYSARFQLGGVNKPAKKMQVVVAMSNAKQGGFAKPFPVAQIWSGNQCQAVCNVSGVEKENPLNPVAVEMSCESMGFSPLAVKAAILWPGERSVYMAKKPTIRFGTWLEGYREAALKVELDRYSMSANANRAVALNR